MVIICSTPGFHKAGCTNLVPIEAIMTVVFYLLRPFTSEPFVARAISARLLAWLDNFISSQGEELSKSLDVPVGHKFSQSVRCYHSVLLCAASEFLEEVNQTIMSLLAFWGKKSCLARSSWGRYKETVSKQYPISFNLALNYIADKERIYQYIPFRTKLLIAPGCAMSLTARFSFYKSEKLFHLY